MESVLKIGFTVKVVFYYSASCGPRSETLAQLGSYTVHDPNWAQALGPKCPTFFLFCFIIVQKWYLLGKCSQSVPRFQRFFCEKSGARKCWDHALYTCQRVIKSFFLEK